MKCVCGHPKRNHIGDVGNCMTPDPEYWRKYRAIFRPCECEVYKEEEEK